MSISVAEIAVPTAESVTLTEDTLSVDLSDGRTITVPLAWFPRLFHATPAERNQWRLIGRGHGIHWGELDEDISVEGLLAGKPSGESQPSFKKRLAWLTLALSQFPWHAPSQDTRQLSPDKAVSGRCTGAACTRSPGSPDFMVWDHLIRGK